VCQHVVVSIRRFLDFLFLMVVLWYCLNECHFVCRRDIAIKITLFETRKIADFLA